MNILLICDDRLHNNFFYDSTICGAIPYLGAIIKKDHTVRYTGHSLKKLSSLVSNSHFDIICFSILTHSDYIFAETRTKLIKNNSSSTVIWGGRYVEHLNILEKCHADVFLIGEGEHTILSFIENYQQSKVDFPDCANLIYKKHSKAIHTIRDYSGLKDLTKFPNSDYTAFCNDLNYKNKTDTFSFISSRGCPFSCSYCHNRNEKKVNPNYQLIRRMAPLQLINEIIAARKAISFKSIRFLDDNFATDPLWRKEFCNLYTSQIGLPFRSIAHPALITEEYIIDLKNAGATTIGLGIETADDEYRKSVLLREGNNDTIIKATKLIQKHGIKVLGLFMYGLPNQKISSDINTLLFAQKILDVDLIQASIFTPIVGTKIFNNKKVIASKQLKRLFYLTPAAFTLSIPLWTIRFFIKLPLGFLYREFYLFFSQYHLVSEHRQAILMRLGMVLRNNIRHNYTVFKKLASKDKCIH